MKKVAVTLPVDERQKELIMKSAPEGVYEFDFPDRRGLKAEDLSDYNVIIGNVPPEFLKSCRSLEWLQLDSAGATTYTADGIMPAGVCLTNATGAYGLAISEYMIGALLMLQKKLLLYHDNMKKHSWSDEGLVSSIWGSSTLVVGMGDIGSEFARRMHDLGSHVTGIRKHYAVKPDYVDAMYPMEELPSLLKKADIVAVTLPGTAENERLFDAEMFSLMKETAYFLNVGRGSIVVTDDLMHALNDGVIAGAAVDVTDPEPLPQNSQFWNAENLLVTPHVSGQYHLPETLERIVRIAGENLRLYSEGKPLKNIVDFATGYRKFIPGPAFPRSTDEKPIILASASPRRRELLSRADIPFIIFPAQGEEIINTNDPVEAAQQLSKQKTEEVIDRMESNPVYDGTEFTVLGADTIVFCGDEIMGKPVDRETAFRYLKLIQGNVHSVVTGVTIAKHHFDESVDFNTFYEKTDVTVYPMTDEQIREYISMEESMDKAGAYAIQGRFARFIKGISGDYSNVVGLPVGRVYRELKSMKKNQSTLDKKS